jgi:sorbitol-6-phosphate 2-dehydrogenase
MACDPRDILNTVAGALRVLAGSADRPKRVCLDGKVETGERMTIDLPDGQETLSGIVAVLRKQADRLREVSAVTVEGVGTFAIREPVGQGRAAGKVALVTGAAQGFGLEIAQDLAREGACVVLGDVNAEGARRAAEALCGEVGPGRAVGLAMNVTDAGSVRAAVDATVRAFGGLDLLVCNAGILRAGSVKDLAESDFDFVTDVNYKGYFLCVQSAAPVMAAGHRADADYTSDIVQINSKSGLVGSNKNGAYAGGKFGGIGLTQSFALELVADGIKVNSICPGNFFDGPLWSDPEDGLFVQYLRTGKVEGAKTVGDVRRGYEAKVPMGRGCRTADVMRAVYYVMEQVYETGQAIPVTGGQVMLK